MHYYESAFLALPYNDAMDYASMARNIAEGEGIASSYLTPLALTHIGEEAPYPNTWRAPLWPIVLAGSFSIFGFSDQVAASTTGFFYIITVIPLVLLARKIAGTLVALAAGLLYLFSPTVLFYSISGMTEPLAAFFMLLWLYMFWKALEKGGHLIFWAGAAGGIFYLARYNALLFFLLSILFIIWRLYKEETAGKGSNRSTLQSTSGLGASGSSYRRFSLGHGEALKKAIPKLAIYLGGWLLVTFPWLNRNISLFGNPFFSLQQYEPAMFTPTYPEYTLYMLPQQISPIRFLLENPGDLWAKIGAGLEAFTQDIMDPGFTGIALMFVPLFFLSPLFRPHRGIKLFVLACFFAQLGALLYIHYIPRLFFIFIPLYAVLALDFAKNLTDLLKKPVVSFILIMLLTVTGIFVNLPDWEEENSWYDWPDYFDSAIEHAREKVPEDGVIISNDGHFLSWYADRLSVKLPKRISQVEIIEDKVPVKGIYLSFRMLYGNTPEAHREWTRVLKEKPEEFEGYKLYHAYGDGSLLYLKEELIDEEYITLFK